MRLPCIAWQDHLSILPTDTNFGAGVRHLVACSVTLQTFHQTTLLKPLPSLSCRTDLRHLPVCSVDPPGCKDIDDALHVRRLPNGNFELGVSPFEAHPSWCCGVSQKQSEACCTCGACPTAVTSWA